MNGQGGKPTALVTGASSGIGLELAKLLAADGHDLVLVARRERELRAVADVASRHGVRAHVVVADLADPGAPVRVAEAVRDAGVEVGVLVNNAGFGLHGAFAGQPLARQLEMVQVNVTALTALAGLFLPGMLARRYGRILNVASTAAFQPGPRMAVYYATKAYVLSLSVALSVELEGTGVTVTALCPGPTTTGFQEVAGMKESRLVRMGTMETGPVARAGYRAMLRGNAIVIPGIRNRVFALATRFGPKRWLAKIVEQMHVLRGA